MNTWHPILTLGFVLASRNSITSSSATSNPLSNTPDVLADILRLGDLAEFKELFDQAPASKSLESPELRAAMAMYGDEECATILLQHYSYEEYTAVRQALVAGNYKTLSVFKESTKELMIELLRTPSDLGWYRCLCERPEMVVQLVKMHPELAHIVDNYLLVVICIEHGFADDLAFFHRNCPNLPPFVWAPFYGSIYADVEAAFVEAVVAENRLDIVDYVARDICNTSDSLEKALHAVASHGAWEGTFKTLINAGVKTGVLTQSQITKYAAMAHDHSILQGNFQLKKMTIRLLMDPTLSLSERIHIMKYDEGACLTTAWLTMQLVGARQHTFWLPYEILDSITRELPFATKSSPQFILYSESCVLL